MGYNVWATWTLRYVPMLHCHLTCSLNSFWTNLVGCPEHLLTLLLSEVLSSVTPSRKSQAHRALPESLSNPASCLTSSHLPSLWQHLTFWVGSLLPYALIHIIPATRNPFPISLLDPTCLSSHSRQISVYLRF